MCGACFDPTGGECGCGGPGTTPCLVGAGSNWCTLCCHEGDEVVVLTPEPVFLLRDELTVFTDRDVITYGSEAGEVYERSRTRLDQKNTDALPALRSKAGKPGYEVTGVERRGDAWVVHADLVLEKPPAPAG